MNAIEPYAASQRKRHRSPRSSSIPIKATVIVLFGVMVSFPSRLGASVLRLPTVAADILETEVKTTAHIIGGGGILADEESSGLVARQFSERTVGLKGSAKNLIEDDSEEGWDWKDKVDPRRDACESCVMDVQCKSGICNKVGQCTADDGLLGDGCKCAKDDQCTSGYCTWKFQCAERKMTEGERGCKENDDCDVGLQCEIEGWGTECRPLRGVGSVCAVDSDCASGDCGVRSWRCPRCCTGTPRPTSSPTASPTVYVPTGCWGNDDCRADSYCAALKKCKPKKDRGAACLFDDECKSGDCDKSFSVSCPSCCE